jgi:TolB-like protein/tRNA A-37 threonylcarbamoyl transferase component Bud32/Tfp pilus assembly protein PilF
MATVEELNAGLAGRYEILREIGAGGMATVYLARDVRHERQVAIKVLREELSASLGKDRFLREIKLAAALQHPHVLPLFDSGDANGLLFYVMPFVDGVSLRQRLVKEGELPVADAARILRDVADALSEAHRHGIVHRDLKPENVMLRGRHALVTDFGVAKALSEATGRQSLTTVGIALGTPTYMAPEQAVADPHVDQRADIYAFGVMAYEILTGQPPFIGLTPQQVLAAHVTSAPEPIGARRSTIPPGLATLVMKCLEKKPADRWQNADDLIPMLESVLTPSGGMTPAETRPHTAVAPAAAPARRRTPALAVAAAMILVAVLAGGAWMWKGRSASSAANDKSIAVLPFEDISGDTANRAFILGMHGEIVTQMTKLPGVQVASRQSSSGYFGTRRPVQSIAKELGVGRILTGTLQRAGGQIHVQAELQDASNGRPLWAESYNQELTTANLFAIEGEVARRVAAALSVTLSDTAVAELSKAPTKSLEALDLYHRGELLWVDRGVPARDTLAVQLLTRAVALDSTFARAWAVLAMTQSYLIRLGLKFDTLPARRSIDRAVALAPRSLETHVASGYYRYYAKGDYAGALADIQEAERSSPRSSELATAEALLLRRLGRYDASLSAMLRALDLDPRNAAARADLAQSYIVLGRYDDGVAAASELIRQQPTSSNGLQYGVYAYLGKGDTANAAAYLAANRSHVDFGDAALIEVPLKLWRRDLRGAMADIRLGGYGFVGADGNASADFKHGAYAAYAVIAKLSGDLSAARRFADSTVAIGNVIKAKADRRAGDPFGIGAFADVNSAIALAAAGDGRAIPVAEAAARRFNAKVDGAEGSMTARGLALVYELAGRPHDAVAQLKILTSVPITVTIAELRSSALWDPLRGDPEFKALIANRP